jgi:acylphosphatase
MRAAKPMAGQDFLPGGIQVVAHWRGVAMLNRRRMHVHYSGRVQGVGFRYTVKTIVTGYEVAGTVRNLSDGRVELVAEGGREELEAFRQAIRESELGHFIEHEDVQWAEASSGFRGFEIVS